MHYGNNQAFQFFDALHLSKDNFCYFHIFSAYVQLESRYLHLCLKDITMQLANYIYI
jgi:hypothetical protein